MLLYKGDWVHVGGRCMNSRTLLTPDGMDVGSKSRHRYNNVMVLVTVCVGGSAAEHRSRSTQILNYHFAIG